LCSSLALKGDGVLGKKGGTCKRILEGKNYFQHCGGGGKNKRGKSTRGDRQRVILSERREHSLAGESKGRRGRGGRGGVNYIRQVPGGRQNKRRRRTDKFRRSVQVNLVANMKVRAGGEKGKYDLCISFKKSDTGSTNHRK